jgi:hypothetical protein
MMEFPYEMVNFTISEYSYMGLYQNMTFCERLEDGYISHFYGYLFTYS